MTKQADELITKMVLNLWKAGNEKVDKIFNSISDEQYNTSITQGSNTAAWILCHIAFVNDSLFTVLGLGKPIYPRLAEIAMAKDSPQHKAISKDELRHIWTTINSRLLLAFEDMPASEWFNRHTSVSEEDFKKEPHRNKLNVLLNRTNHQAHHAGQLALIK